MAKLVTIILLTALCIIIKEVAAQTPTGSIQIWDRINFDDKGSTIVYQIKGTDCQSIPPKWNNRAKSVKLHGKCAELYDTNNCTIGDFCRALLETWGDEDPSLQTVVGNKGVVFKLSSFKGCL